MASRAADPSSAGWGTVAWVSGLVAGVCLFIGSGLFLLDELELLAAQPVFRQTAAGPEVDTATWFVAYFERQHSIVWSIAIRDAVLPVAAVALMTLSLATADLVGWRRPDATLMVLFFVVGGLLHLVNNLMYLGALPYWLRTDWSADPPGPVLSAGRAAEAINNVTIQVETFSYVVLLAAAVCLGRLCRARIGLPRRLGTLAYAQAAGLLLLAVGHGVGLDVVPGIGGLMSGVVLGPILATSLGRAVRAAQRSRQPAAEPLAS